MIVFSIFFFSSVSGLYISFIIWCGILISHGSPASGCMYISTCFLVASSMSSVIVASSLLPPVRSRIIGWGSFLSSRVIVDIASSISVNGTSISLGESNPILVRYASRFRYALFSAPVNGVCDINAIVSSLVA